MARRVYKRFPLLAVEIMRKTYPDYNPIFLKNDLKLTKPKKKKRGKKTRTTGKRKYAEKLRQVYLDTKDIKDLRRYKMIIDNLSKDWIVKIVKWGRIYEFHYSNMIDHERIEELVKALNAAKTINDYYKEQNRILRYCRYFFPTKIEDHNGNEKTKAAN